MVGRTFLILLALAAGGPVLGVELSPEDVTAAVTTWIQRATADARPDALIVSLEPYPAVGRPAAYRATLSTGGYALCGADDRLLPVYLYSAEVAYDPTDPVDWEILKDVARRLAAIEAAEARAPVSDAHVADLTERAEFWRALQMGRVPAASLSRSGPTSMTLPVTDSWHQGAPYNHACPVLIPGSEERVVVGCVATAMAEIMYYWQWPATGQGSGSTDYQVRYSNTWLATTLATDPGIPPDWAGGDRLMYIPPQQALAIHGYWDGSIYWDGARKLSDDAEGNPDPDYLAALEFLWDALTLDTRPCPANFAATTFDWTQIQDAHSLPYGAEDQAVAWLNYCAGVAVEMAYGVWASSSNISRAANAYSDYFRYDPAAFADGLSVSTMIEEIQWLRPVQMSGQSEAGGHSFVVCGYNEGVAPAQFLINKGWGGGATSWLTLDQFFPDNQGYVIRIAPLGVVRFVGGMVGGTGAPDRPYVTLGVALADAPDDTTLIMKAGSSHVLPSSTGALDRPMVLKGRQVTIDRN